MKFIKGVDYRSYDLRETNQKYRPIVAENRGKFRARVQGILGDRTFKGTDQISILRFIREYHLACEQIHLSESADIYSIKHFVRGEPKLLFDLRTGKHAWTWKVIIKRVLDRTAE